MSITELISRAAQHDPTAMWELAEAYYWGKDVAEDNDKAFSLYKSLETINPNDDRVLQRLGKCYFNGFGTEKDNNVGITYFQKAADRGSGDASFNLANIYKDGESVPQNITLAISYLTKAINLGNDDAMVTLGDMYHSGDGVDQDETKACQYYKMAVDCNNSNACYRLGMQTYNGWGVPEDRQLGISYWTKGAELEHWGCQYILGNSYLNGDDVSQDTDRGIYWLRKSADRGLEDARLMLGKIYLNGLNGVQANDAEGIKYLSAAADENNNIEAMICLGDYYVQKKDGASITESAKWYEKAAEHDVFYAVHMAAITNKISALAGSMSVRRTNQFGYEFSKDDWKKVIELTQKEIEMIRNGAPDTKPGDLENAVAQLNQAKYEMAICYYELKDYSSAASLVKDSPLANGQLLYAVIINRLAKDHDMANAVRLLANAFLKAENASDRTYEEEEYFALASVILSYSYRAGLPGFTNQDLNAAVKTLNTALAQLKIQDWVQYVSSELAHYKPKMFGGYKYV